MFEKILKELGDEQIEQHAEKVVLDTETILKIVAHVVAEEQDWQRVSASLVITTDNRVIISITKEE